MREKIYKLLSGARQGSFSLAFTMLFGAAYSQTTYTFSYTGSSQTISLPAGSYSIACWGANGGSVAANTGTPGTGGYSGGSISLSTTTTFTVYVGGRGNGGSQPLGGFNSGNTTTKTNTTTATGGGGASDVRVINDNYFHRIIVAGGGGGQGTSTGTGGHGGGLTGQNGQGTTNAGVGGSQTAPGLYPPGGDAKPATFGEGGDGPAGTTGGQGGGGWYGGSFGTRTNGGGAGGSGYVLSAGSFSPVGYFAANPSYYFTSTVTAMPGTAGYVPNPDVTGHGRVHITELCNITLSTSASGSVDAIICSGQSLTLTTNAVSGYSWSTGQTTSSIVVAPTTNTVYSITGTSPLACTASASRSITVSSGIPVLSISTAGNTLCLGQSTSFTATGALSYSWTNGITNGIAFTPTVSSTYTVSGQNGCGISTATTAVTIAPLPVSVTGPASTVCAGVSSTLMASSSASNFTWQPSGATSSMVVVSPAVSTVYTVTASNGTCIGTANYTVSAIPLPTVTAMASATSICDGTPVTLTASGGVNYNWTPGNLSGSSITVTPNAPTQYSVSGSNAQGCDAGATAVIIVFPAPTINASSSDATICEGQSATLTVNGTAVSYLWSNNATSSVVVVNPTQSTLYTVTGTGGNSCTATASVNVGVFIPSISITGNTAVCSGETATMQASGANSYTWSNGTLAQFNSVSPLVTTVYTVSTITNTLSINCASSSTFQVMVRDNPTVVAQADRTVACRNETVTVTASGANSYTWSNTATGASISITSSLVTTVQLNVTGTDANGCKGSTGINISINGCNGLSNVNLSGGIKMYPNPAIHSLMIVSDEDVELTVISGTGAVVKTISKNAGESCVDISELVPGIYFVSGKQGQNLIREKLVISR